VTRVRAASTSGGSPRDEVARAARRLDHVGVARVERGNAKRIRPPPSSARKSGTTAGALDERPADRPGVGVAERDVPAAAGGVARRGQREPQRRQPGVVGLDEQVGQRRVFAAIAAMPACAVSWAPDSTAARPRITGVPARKRSIPSTGS
jgi:hypothetical protein